MPLSSSWTRLVRGTVVIRRNSRLLTLLIVVIAVLVIWELFVLATSTYARRLPAQGSVISNDTGAEIVAPQAGILVGPVPEAGQGVTQRQPLFQIQSADASTARFDEPGANLERKRAQTLLALEEIAGQRRIAQDNHEASIAGLRRQIAVLESTKTSQQSSIDMVEERLSNLEASGDLFSPREVEAARLELLNEREQLSRTQAEQLRIEQNIQSEIEAYAQRLANLDEREHGLQLQLVDLDSNETEQERSAAVEVLSPIEGSIAASLVGQGQAVRQGQVLAIVDAVGNTEDKPDRVRLNLSPSAAAAVETGTEVWVEVDSFPAREFGLFQGRVSAMAHMDQAQTDQEPVFVVEAILEPRELRQFGRPAHLRRGMSVKANVVTERLTLIEWALEPVLVALGKQSSVN